jgi:hypothetical protein
VLPLDAVLTTALRALRKRQAAERLEAGPAYEASGYVVTDELGRPVHPERFTDEFIAWPPSPGARVSGCTTAAIQPTR